MMRNSIFIMVIVITGIFSGQAHSSIVSGSTMINPANGHTYHLITTQTWTDSEAEAVSLGGHLVTINDQSEQDWVFENFANFGGNAFTIWIGLHQLPGSIEPDQGWEWISGEPITYTNWDAGSPDNAEGNQHYGYMFH